MSKRFSVVFLFFTMILSACAKNGGITYTAPELTDGWSIKMNLSGGFDGLVRNIEIDSDGDFVVADEIRQKTVEGKLTKDELEELVKLISSLTFNPVETETGCADCFLYHIEIESSERKMVIEADDVTLGDSGMGELTQFLRGIMDSALY